MTKVIVAAGNQTGLPDQTGIETFAMADGGVGAYSAVVDPATPANALKPDAAGNMPITVAALPLPAGAATAVNQATELASLGTDITTPTAMPAGGTGVRGWLSAIWTKLNGSLAVTGAFFQATQPVSIAATVAVSNASLPLPTGAATEAGHLATIDTSTAKIPSQGQALAAGSMPVVLTAIQQAALTPPAAITGFALEAGHLAAIDASTAKIPSPGQALAAGSVPVVLTAAQQTALTPPAAIAGFALEAGHLAAIDASTAKIPSLGQALAAGSVPIVLTAAQQTALTPPSNTGYALDGTDITTPTAMPVGGVGIRGWLSAIWTKLNSSISVTGTFWQATQPVSGTVTATVAKKATLWATGGPVSRGTGLTTELNSLANGAYSAAGTAIDNTTNRDQYGACDIVLASLTPTTGANVSVYLVQSLDGTTYEDAPSATNPGSHALVATVLVATGAAAKRVMTPWFYIPPGKFKLVFLNATGAPLAAASNTVTVYTSNDEAQ